MRQKDSAARLDHPFTKDTQLEDLVQSPNKYGAPTFEEFKRNYTAWMNKLSPSHEDGLITLTDGPKKFRKDLNKIIFKLNGFEMTPEKLQVALTDYGYSDADIDLENRNSTLKKDIQMVPQGGGKYDIVVNFLP